MQRGRCLTLTEGEWQMHALGPTACTAHPKVLKNIKKQFDEHNIVSTQELQIARRMGIVATTLVARPGFNDGIFFPYERSTGGPALEPVSPEPKKPQKRKMHAIALLVDFSDNKESGWRRILKNYSLTKRTRIRWRIFTGSFPTARWM